MSVSSAARAVVRAAAWIVPQDARAEWRREWETELAWLAGGAWSQCARACGAWPHAVWMRTDAWRWEMVWQNIRLGARALRRRPGFTLIAAASLAIGIGANTAIFGAVRAVLLRPLPFPEPDRLVAISTVRRVDGRIPSFGGASSAADFTDERAQSTSFVEMAATNSASFALTGDGPAEQVSAAWVTGGYFTVMGVAPALGRAITPADAVVGGPKAVVMSDALWRRCYASSPAVVGRSLVLDGTPYEVIGVMPPGFHHPGRADLWVPLAFSEARLASQRGAHYLDVYARLRPEVSARAADTDVRGIADRLATAYPRTNRALTATVTPLHDAMVGDVRRPLLALLAAVGVVLLIVCANVASLSLTRALGRRREFAIRASLGETRAQLTRALIVESVLLSGVGLTCGLLLARALTAGIVAASHTLDVPLLSTAHMDADTLLFAVALGVLTTVACGTLPGWQAAARLDLARGVRDEGGAATADRARQRTRAALIIVEASLAVVLLVGAGLLMRSFLSLTAVRLGFAPDAVQKFDLSLPAQTYATPEARETFVGTLLERVSADPDVEHAAVIFGLPLTGFAYSITASRVDERALAGGEEDRHSLQVRVVSPDYFRAMHIALLRGRTFAPSDSRGSAPVAIVNDAAVRNLWPDGAGLGHTVEIGTTLGVSEHRVGGEVVGVVDDVRDFGPNAAVRPTIYVPYAQFPMDYMSVVIKPRADTPLATEKWRTLVAALDPALPVYDERTLRSLAADAVQQPRVLLLLIGTFAVAAALLAALGIYGLLAHVVGARTREIGLRLALGAAPGRVVWLVVTQALWLAGLGIALGLAASAAAGRLVQGLLFHTSAIDPGTYAVVVVGFAGVALVAAWLPARRAARVDPLTAIRAQ